MTEKKKSKENKENNEKNHFESEKDIAMDFALKAHKKFDRLIKATILFGSQAKNSATKDSDIDIIIVIDDAAIKWDLELVSWYREELGKLVSMQNYPKELHINTIKLTTWWHDLLEGDPVLINIVRYGEALIDSGGFYNPIKALLIQGKIHSTPEAVYNLLQRAPNHLGRSKASVLSAIEGVYWTMVDSSQAALMTAGKIPPSPEHVPELLTKTFVDSGMLKSTYVKNYSDIFALHKSISHGKINAVKGNDIDQWQLIAEDFMLTMTKLVDSLIDASKK
jgi:predicted nucleotidyltransferase/uncharacterized protein (UPF0332 family)